MLCIFSGEGVAHAEVTSPAEVQGFAVDITQMQIEPTESSEYFGANLTSFDKKEWNVFPKVRYNAKPWNKVVFSQVGGDWCGASLFIKLIHYSDGSVLAVRKIQAPHNNQGYAEFNRMLIGGFTIAFALDGNYCRGGAKVSVTGKIRWDIRQDGPTNESNILNGIKHLSE